MWGAPSRHLGLAAIALVSLCALHGCATLEPLEPNNQYPTRKEVNSYWDDVVPEPEMSLVSEARHTILEPHFVDQWTLKNAPLRTGDTSMSPRNALESFLVASGQGLSYQGSCNVEERVRFRARHGARASDELRNYMRAHCGVSHDFENYRLIVKEKTEPTEYSPERVLEEYGDDLARAVAELECQCRSPRMSIAFDQDATHVFVAVLQSFETLYRAPDDASPRLRRDTDGNVRVRLRSRRRLASVRGFVSLSSGEAVDCRTLESDQPRTLELSCPIGGDVDRAALVIDLLVLSGKRWREDWFTLNYTAEGSDPRRYERSFYPGVADEHVLEPDAQGFNQSFVDGLNAFRAERGLPPFVEDERQTRVVGHLYPLMMSKRGDFESYFAIMNAIRAGWEVAVPDVIGAVVGWESVDGHRSTSLGEMLSESYTLRRVALHPGTGQVALGRNIHPDGSYRLFVILYEQMPDTTHYERIKKYTKTINRMRERIGKRKVRRYRDFNDLTAALSGKVESGEISPARAREDIRREVSKTLGYAVSTYGFFVSDLDHISVSGSLVELDDVNVAMMVAPYHSKTHPHSRYLVVIAFAWLPE